jgi:hypothetical protein
MAEGASWGLPPLESPEPWMVQTANEVESSPAAVGGPAVTPVHFVGVQKESAGQGADAAAHAAVGSCIATPSCGA